MAYLRQHPAWLLGLAFLALGLGTRFYRLGWSFSGDETTSFAEADSLLQKPLLLSEYGYADRQGRAQPIGYLLQAATYHLFGTSEIGARTGVALFGAMGIALVVVMTCHLYDTKTAVVLGFLVVLCPWHLGFSQGNRVYSYAFVFASLALLSAAMAWKKNALRWGVVSGVASALAVSSQNTSALIPVALAAFVVLEWLRSRENIPRRSIVGYLIPGLPLLLIAAVLAWTAMHGWAGEQNWGGGSVHTLMGLAYNLTWSVACLACLGWIWAWYKGDAIDRLWATGATVAGIACCVAPFFVAFRHDYVFACSLVFFMLATRALVAVTSIVATHSRFLAVGLSVAVLAFPLPQFISHYKDGNRPDWRAAAECIRQNMQPGDIIAGHTKGPLYYYLHLPIEHVPPPYRAAECISTLSRFHNGTKRVWVVWRVTRDDIPPSVDRWLWEHAVRYARLKEKRFDYHENIVEVYLLQPSGFPDVRPNP